LLESCANGQEAAIHEKGGGAPFIGF
jgi:hypothetical protein